jgi:exopolysaccharide biosynthesis WecB/TagA/CpsF family protein
MSVRTSTKTHLQLDSALQLDKVVHEIDDFDLAGFVSVAENFDPARYGYVVTPNVDHLIRYHDNPTFREHYAAASFVLMDSRFASRLVRLLKGQKLPVCTGADLTATLLRNSVSATDRILMIGGPVAQSQTIAKLFGLRNLEHYNPPMGFIGNAAALEECLKFIEDRSPFRFCFIGVGSPQQEAVAHALRVRGIARGLALCVGASVNFITGSERRAPQWMQQAGIEWLYRLMQNPRRLARRYLIRGPRFFALLARSEFVLRKPGGGAN